MPRLDAAFSADTANASNNLVLSTSATPIAIPAGADTMRIISKATSDVYIKFGGSTVVATSADSIHLMSNGGGLFGGYFTAEYKVDNLFRCATHVSLLAASGTPTVSIVFGSGL